MADFTKTRMDELTLESLADENIKPKEDYPYVWKVGNKNLSLSEIQDLYKMATMRAVEFEMRTV